MSEEPLETKYPNLKTLSRTEIDQIILNQLEVLANELARLSKRVEEIARKI